MTFEVGDIVKCVCAGGYPQLVDGALYTVRYIAATGMVGIFTDEGEYFTSRFVLATNLAAAENDLDEIHASQEIYGKLEASK